MRAPLAHAVMAAALADPALLARWRRDPEALRALGAEPDEVDLEALWKFAGLSEKVRANGCRDDLPLTFRLLNRTGLEIDAFGCFAAHASALRRTGKTAVADRTAALTGFLCGWLDPADRDQALVLTLLDHEMALAEIRGCVRASPPSPFRERGAGGVRSAGVPSIAGVLLLRRMAFDPRIIAACVQQSSPGLSEIERDEVRLGYFWDGTGEEVALFSLDELGFCLLSLIDGARTVPALAARLGAGVSPERLLPPLAELSALGLVRFGARAGGGAACA